MDEAESRASEPARSTTRSPVKFEPLLLKFVRILVVPVAGTVVPSSPVKQYLLSEISGPIMHETSLIYVRLLPMMQNTSRRACYGATIPTRPHAAASRRIVRDRFRNVDQNLGDVGLGRLIVHDVGEVHDLIPAGLAIQIHTAL